MSSAGAPLAVLSDCSAYALHLGLRSWLRVADVTHAASAYVSALPVPLPGLLHSCRLYSKLPCCFCPPAGKSSSFLKCRQRMQHKSLEVSPVSSVLLSDRNESFQAAIIVCHVFAKAHVHAQATSAGCKRRPPLSARLTLLPGSLQWPRALREQLQSHARTWKPTLQPPSRSSLRRSTADGC